MGLQSGLGLLLILLKGHLKPLLSSKLLVIHILDLNLTVLLIVTFINIVFYTYRKLQRRFDLYYYDGLARQDEEIRLTIGEQCGVHFYMNYSYAMLWQFSFQQPFQQLLFACSE